MNYENYLYYDSDIDDFIDNEDNVGRPIKRLRPAVQTKEFFALTTQPSIQVIKPLNLVERREAKWLVIRMILAAYHKNSSPISKLPYDILKIIIKYIDGLTAMEYRKYQEYLKNRPYNGGFRSKCCDNGIILCKPIQNN